MGADGRRDHEVFSSRLRVSRLAAGWSQEDLAGRSGVSVRTISDLERGRTRWPHPASVERLADALGLDGARRAEFLALAARRLAPSAVPGAEVTAGYGRLLGQGIPPEPAGQAAEATGLAVHAGPHPALGVRYSLPPDTAAFTGRQAELARITAAVDGAPGTGGVLTIHAIGGMPGVGKTALAVHAAHLLADRFPDRQLFLSLHAHTPARDPVTPEAALAGLLAAVGVDTPSLPGDLEGRAALWRDRMAGQKAVLVLDNAASSAQVTPLLPGSEGCLVLVTSRRYLGDLPGAAAPVLLETLSAQEAREMFVRLAPRAAAGPHETVAELAELAGSLPLAVSLLARVCARHPSWTLADLAAETRTRMLTMAAESDSVDAAFGVSYHHLDPRQQEFFRRLGLHLGTVIDGYAAAALAGVGLEEASGQLDALHREGLLTEAGHRRYGMHDLIRRYARDLAATEPAAARQQALERLLDYYQHTAACAETILGRPSRSSEPAGSRQAPPAAVPAMTGSAEALAWARAERGNLLACLDHATAGGQHARVVALTAAMGSLLRHDGPWASAITRHATAVTAARHLGDRLGQAHALTSLGDLRRITGDYRGAGEALEEALGIFRDTGHGLGQAETLSVLGVVRRVTGDYRGAGEALEEALGIFCDTGHGLGQAETLTVLGVVRRETGDYRGAGEALEEALSIFRDAGFGVGQANALMSLGILRRMTGDYRGAGEALEEALSIFRDAGRRLGQAGVLASLAVVRRMTGAYHGAGEALKEALGLSRDIGDRPGEAEILNETGTLHRVRGDPGRGEQYHQQALDLAHEIASPQDEARALAGLGRCALAGRRTADAIALLQRARDIFQKISPAEAADVAAELRAISAAGPLGAGES